MSSEHDALDKEDMLMTPRFRLFSIVAAFLIVVTACGGDDGGSTIGSYELVAADTLTVCTDAPYIPMEYEEDGEFTGFDIELMRAIADDLGVGLAVVNSGFDPITSGLAMTAGDCDIAAASITITPEREENIDFSDGYFSGDQSLLVKKDAGISTLADLAGKNIGVQTGTTGEAYANANNPGATIVSFESPGDLLTALEAGNVDAVLQDLVPNQAKAIEDDTVTVAETFATGEEYGFAVKEEGADDLLTEVNASLAKLRDDGTYDRIYEEFFPTA
jgi:polar amino acid transport system substrate-binding protein